MSRVSDFMDDEIDNHGSDDQPRRASAPRGVVPVVKPVVTSFVTNDAKTFNLTVQTGRTICSTQGTFQELTSVSERKVSAAWEAFKTALVQFAADQVAYLPKATEEPPAA